MRQLEEFIRALLQDVYTEGIQFGMSAPASKSFEEWYYFNSKDILKHIKEIIEGSEIYFSLSPDILDWFANNYREDRDTCYVILWSTVRKGKYTIEDIKEFCEILIEQKTLLTFTGSPIYPTKDELPSLQSHLQWAKDLEGTGVQASKAGELLAHIIKIIRFKG